MTKFEIDFYISKHGVLIMDNTQNTENEDYDYKVEKKKRESVE